MFVGVLLNWYLGLEASEQVKETWVNSSGPFRGDRYNWLVTPQSDSNVNWPNCEDISHRQMYSKKIEVKPLHLGW